MWSVGPIFLLLVALATIDAAPKHANYANFNRGQRNLGRWKIPHFGARDLDGIDGSLIGRNLDGIGGGNLIGRDLDGIDGSLIGRSLDGIGGGNLIGRDLDGIDGSLLGRDLDGIDGSLIGRDLDGIDGSLIGRDLDGIDGSLIGRSLDSIGGSNLIGRDLDGIDGSLIGRDLDGIDGSLLGRSLDSIGGSNLIGRDLDGIDGSLIGRSLSKYTGKSRKFSGGKLNGSAYSEFGELMVRKPGRNLGVLQLGGGFGIAKRYSPPSGKYQTKTEKHRRGPLNGLIPGGAFGRAARSNCVRDCQSLMYDKLMKYLKFPTEEKFQPYVSFESRNQSDDGKIVKDGRGELTFTHSTNKNTY